MACPLCNGSNGVHASLCPAEPARCEWNEMRCGQWVNGEQCREPVGHAPPCPAEPSEGGGEVRDRRAWTGRHCATCDEIGWARCQCPAPAEPQQASAECLHPYHSESAERKTMYAGCPACNAQQASAAGEWCHHQMPDRSCSCWTAAEARGAAAERARLMPLVSTLSRALDSASGRLRELAEEITADAKETADE